MRFDTNANKTKLVDITQTMNDIPHISHKNTWRYQLHWNNLLGQITISSSINKYTLVAIDSFWTDVISWTFSLKIF